MSMQQDRTSADSMAGLLCLLEEKKAQGWHVASVVFDPDYHRYYAWINREVPRQITEEMVPEIDGIAPTVKAGLQKGWQFVCAIMGTNDLDHKIVWLRPEEPKTPVIPSSTKPKEDEAGIAPLNYDGAADPSDRHDPWEGSAESPAKGQDSTGPGDGLLLDEDGPIFTAEQRRRLAESMTQKQRPHFSPLPNPTEPP